MGSKTADLIAQTLRWDDSLPTKNSSSKIFLGGFKRFRDTYDFIDDALVGVEVKGKAGVAIERRRKLS